VRASKKIGVGPLRYALIAVGAALIALVAAAPAQAAAPERQTLNSAGLPDNRGIELVSPADKGPSGSVASLDFPQQLRSQASEDGQAFAYPIQNGIPSSTAGGWLRMKASRTEAGWLSAQISAPSLIPPPEVNDIGFALPSAVMYASPDLGCAILDSYQPLTEDIPQLSRELGVVNLFRWSADGDYDLITNRVPLNPELVIGGGRDYRTIETSDDCSRVFFSTQRELIADASGLYEWDEGTLRDAGVLSVAGGGFEAGAGAVVGGEVNNNGTARWNAVSPDGSLFFTALSNEGPSSGKPAVFMREDGGASVVEISQSETAVPTNGARFEAASPDGSRVFFRANYGIDAENSSAGPTNEACGPLSGETVFDTYPPIEKKPCDLYVYDTGKPAGERLTDLSADANPGDPIGAAVQGTVAIDEDGSHVYFAVLGQLILGKGRTYAENVAGEGSANIYLAHDGQLAYVTTLNRGNATNGDLFGGANFDGMGVMMHTPRRWTAETTADGRRLLFGSSANLTGQNSGGGKAAYLYSADTGELTCVSCRLDGQPTLVGGDGCVDHQTVNCARLLAEPRGEVLTHRRRSMSEDGSHVFFTSPDVLAPGAVAGKRNVYEWQNGQVYFLAITEPSGAGGLGSYLDTSASGDDVFIATNEQLVPRDKDFVADVYDLRVNGGFPPEVVPVPCDPAADQCQGAPTPQPAAPSPASSGFQGPGNPRPCPKGKVRRGERCVGKLALARRACRKKHGKAKRRCIAKQVHRLNRIQHQSRAADTNRRGVK
jgi:hypothetical protein